jgi:hypothetical protein
MSITKAIQSQPWRIYRTADVVFLADLADYCSWTKGLVLILLYISKLQHWNAEMSQA